MLRKNALKEELIGKNITIIHSKNSQEKGIQGKIVDETFHCLKIQTQGKINKMFKKNLIFRLETDGTDIIIEGKNIEKRSEDRIKGN